LKKSLEGLLSNAQLQNEENEAERKEIQAVLAVLPK